MFSGTDTQPPVQGFCGPKQCRKIAEDLDDDGEPIQVNMEGLEDSQLPNDDYEPGDDSYTTEDEEDLDDLDFDEPMSLEDAGFTIADADSIDSMFGED